MNPELKEKWLRALRSGEYKQTRGELARCNKETESFSYCCLGVLYDISKVGLWSYYDDYDYCTYISQGETNRALIHHDDCVKFGLNNQEQLILAKLNDRLDITFNDVADYIEKNL